MGVAQAAIAEAIRRGPGVECATSAMRQLIDEMAKSAMALDEIRSLRLLAPAAPDAAYLARLAARRNEAAAALTLAVAKRASVDADSPADPAELSRVVGEADARVRDAENTLRAAEDAESSARTSYPAQYVAAAAAILGHMRKTVVTRREAAARERDEALARVARVLAEGLAGYWPAGAAFDAAMTDPMGYLFEVATIALGPVPPGVAYGGRGVFEVK